MAKDENKPSKASEIAENIQHTTVPASTMESVLDRTTLRIWGHPLTIKQQIWIGYLLPTSFVCALFIANFSTDIGVVYQLFRDKHPIFASVSLLLLYSPAVLCLILTAVQPPNLKSVQEYTVWVIIQILHSSLFPIGVLHRCATRIFWSVCALLDEDPAREIALQNASKPHQMELFLLFDAFLHAAPQAVLQTYILLSPKINTSDSTDITQAVCVIISVTSLALTVARYQRFESQRLVGRKEPWERGNLGPDFLQIDKFDPFLLTGLQSPAQPTKPTKMDQTPPSIQITEATATEEPTVDISQTANIEHEATATEQPTVDRSQTTNSETEREETDDHNITSAANRMGISTSLIKSPELPTSHQNTEEPTENDTLLPTESNNDNVQQDTSVPSTHHQNDKTTPPGIQPSAIPIDQEARYFWPHIDTPPSTPTADPHMRPRLSISTARNPTNPPLTAHIALPMRKPRIKGLAEDEPIGTVVAFFGWWCFLIARILALSAFAHFYLWASLGLLVTHYIVMVSYLLLCSSGSKIYAIGLGLIFLLCPVEIKTRFKYPRLFLISFAVVVMVENIATMVLWYYGAYWSSWWYRYTCFSILGALALATINAALYIFLCRPKPKHVY